MTTVLISVGMGMLALVLLVLLFKVSGGWPSRTRR